MTSTSIYTPITPTYLYIKQHSITKKKYFGKTTRDPYTYNGSGKYWCNHIKKHGKEHIVTLWVSELYYDASIVEVALKFSVDNDIVNSDEWANLIPENGLDGGASGEKPSEETKAKMRRPRSEEAKANMKACAKGRVAPNKGKSKSQEAKDKISANMTGKKRGPYKKSSKPRNPRSDKGEPRKQVTCPHCGKLEVKME